MVATDVASRGIGMIQTPSPSPLSQQQYQVAYSVVPYSQRYGVF